MNTKNKGTFFNSIFEKNRLKKSSRQTIVRQVFLILFCFLVISPLHADIQFNGTCGSYAYKLNIPTNKFYGSMCKNGGLIVYNNKNTDEIQNIYADPSVSEWIDIYDAQNYKVLNSFDSSLNEGYVKYVGENGGLTYVLAGSFIGFTILFFSSFLFIEVAKK